MSPIEKPSCPACGTPASLIEDGYAIDLVPWWKYLWQRFNPWRLVFPWPKTDARWIPFSPAVFKTPAGHVALLYEDKTVCTFTRNELHARSHRFEKVTHYCPLPSPP